MSTLYIVSTPIGNLGDITYRAVEVLSTVHRVLAEDTRRTSILCRRYGIDTPLVSAHAHNEAARAALAIEWLESGHDVALVSDAGTPLLSDPGSRIVREVVAAGHDVVPVPGASALLPALVASGLPTDRFTFFGFLPRGARERAEAVRRAAALDHTSVFYEAPGRLLRLLRELKSECGGERAAAVARELTKLHESIVRGTLSEIVAYYEGERVRGEVVVLLAGEDAPGPADAATASRLARSMLDAGARPSAVARELARRLGLTRNEAYAIALTHAAETEVD
jgi:16S rRNA (cytidine1402-2'-O)-methyltransferase